MKIMQINTVCGIGSTGRITLDLYNAIHDIDGLCLIAYGRGRAPEEINSYKIGSSIDNKIHGVLTRIADMHGFGSCLATKLLIMKINEYNPDIIHLHNIHGYYLNIEILFSYLKISKKKIIWTLHDCWAFTGHCAYPDYTGCDKWIAGCYKCPQKKQYPKNLLLDRSQWNYYKKKRIFTSLGNITIITPSKWLQGEVERSFLGKYEVKTIYNGIDLDVFRPPLFSKPEKEHLKRDYNCQGKFVILGVANIWEERKGLNYFIELAARLNAEYQIVLVGISKKEKSLLPQNIISIERTANLEELKNIYAMSDVFVNPTLGEALGLTNIEALACGTPVITFASGGSPECIDESCGIVVAKGDLTELKNAIYEIKSSPFDITSCLKRSQLFNKKIKYQEYVSLYREKMDTKV